MAGKLVIDTIQDGAGNSTSATDAIKGSAKAWVNFNGAATAIIQASYNVSSVTRNGLGDYTVNFTNALADTKYSAACQVEYTNAGTYTAIGNSSSRAAGSYRFWSWGGSAVADFPSINCNFFR